MLVSLIEWIHIVAQLHEPVHKSSVKWEGWGIYHTDLPMSYFIEQLLFQILIKNKSPPPHTHTFIRNSVVDTEEELIALQSH